MKNPVVFGPTKVITVPFKRMKGGQRIERDEVSRFWESEEAKKFAEKKGVYVFIIKATKALVPWYVGQATKTFKQEIFTDDKLEKYNSALAEYNQHFSPYVQFLIPEVKKGKPNYRAIDELEKTLTIWGKERNPSLKNIQNTSDIKTFIIKGVTSSGKSGKPTNEVRAFRKVFKDVIK